MATLAKCVMHSCTLSDNLSVHSVRYTHVSSMPCKGRAVGIATVLRSAPMLIPHGEIRLPRELLSKHHVNTRGLSAAPAGLDNVAFALGSIANTHLENARSLSLPRDAVAPLLPAVAAQRFLRQLERAAFDTFDPKLQRRDSTLPLALLWARVAGSL
eukprot:m.374576 g.374576  ORF g.374576 m.374576 type:complete len:157 (+) comp20908_c0_seq12:128-598(+)